ncbi:Similar to Transposon TX1 uncharacterized 82 kDa protein (Xenopus laevis) [Cotesia congregata]|uniref:Similar to Transposon TX1 uncharacterized 82 kDa protein (Xenopus laevis) n=1 Tax=Cotesia congregata TaxID=51543 RepID=A0A8J2HLQ7_COTCN|nr:Similar to Transposon TX1 uncharacterized 82 kDa protein (Xenopus laevis) [Cotesia congregata]
MSNITTLRAGLNNAGYQHILSFRRQLYIKPEDVKKLSTSWKVDFDETSYWIYPTMDNMLCYVCKEEGHLAKSCPTDSNLKNSQNPEENNLLTASQTSCNEQSLSPAPVDNNNSNKEQTKFPSLPAKRPLSSTSSTAGMPPPATPLGKRSENLKDNLATKQKSKKIRTEDGQLHQNP